jgi:hypothetical protein
MYMGEIVRLIILDLWEKELLFVGHRDHNWSTDYRYLNIIYISIL